MEVTHNVVGWFEIPVADMERALKFYESVFQVEFRRMQMGPLDMAMFPQFPDAIGAAGALVKHDFYKPSTEGVLIYFTAFSGDVAVELARAEAAGGKVCVPKKLIAPDIGTMAVFQDTEGNKIALHCR